MGDITNKAEDLKGRAKEAAGDMTDDRGLETEGKVDQASAWAKDKVDKAKDKVHDMVDRD
jgi:uncharacterized protein YjbJ (UPF0337 family)